MLKYHEHKNIDKTLWDNLVVNSKNAEIFCFSWYLDQFCTWDAIILGNYEGAIALPTKTKFTFKMLYQPTFIQKCIWFGAATSDIDIENILIKVYDKIHFNTSCKISKCTSRNNFFLDLDTDLTTLKSKFSNSLKRNLKPKIDLTVQDCSPKEVFQLYLERYGNLSDHITIENFKLLEESISLNPKYFKAISVTSENDILASLFYLINPDHKRIHYIMGAPTDKGRTFNAMTLGHMHIITEYISTKWIFDFEGSSIPNVAEYYRRFGSTNTPFYEIRIIPNVALRLIDGIYKRLKRS